MVVVCVVADYNGDGKDDVALDGYNANEELIFVILSDGDKYRAVENEGQAGTLHCWRDGRFVELITGD